MSEKISIMPEVEREEDKTFNLQPAKMEFRLINPTEDNFLRVIKWNKEELEAAVRQKMANYENTVYTEDNIKQAKADRAELNKLTKAIEERRKMVKKIINEPYDIFEAELKTILALIQKPVGIIDKQVKLFEDKQKDEKKKSIQKYYYEVIGDLEEALPFEKIFDNRYLNQTYKLAAVQTDIKEKIEKVHTDLETIDSLESKFKLNAKDVYIKTLDISKALAENKRLSELEEKLEAEKRRKAEEAAEKKRLAEERRKAVEEKAKAEEEQRKALESQRKEKYEIVANQQENVAKPAENISEDQNSILRLRQGGVEANPAYENGKIVQNPEQQIHTETDTYVSKHENMVKRYKTKFYVKGTREQLGKLVQFMNENGIEYGRIN